MNDGIAVGGVPSPRELPGEMAPIRGAQAPRWHQRRLASCWGLILAALLAAPPARAAEEAVALPPFFVDELTRGPAWRYGEAMGFEILSRCRDATTRRVVETHHQLHALLAELLPPSLQLQFSVPRTLILYDEELSPASSQEVIRRMLRPDPSVSEVDDSSSATRRGFRMPGPQRRFSFLPNLRLWDRDAMAIFMIARRDDFEAEHLSLTPDYVTFLVKNRLPALPPWFISGLLSLYHQTTYGGNQLAVEPLEWISPAHTEALKKDPKTAPPVGLPADLFLHKLAPRDPAQVADPLQVWQAQAALFVRWGLHADQHAHRPALWKFVEQSAIAGASERLFVECFGFDFTAARARLAAYLPNAVRKTIYFHPERIPPLPAFTLAPATDTQIARLKGEWERLEVPYVKAISADLAPKYLEQARRTLKRAYDRDHRDPRLLAVMGLCEVDAGNDAAARDYLEGAARLGPIRPRANYELARLRLAEYRANAAGPAGRLSVTQVADVLGPLFSARADAPSLPEVYELIGDVWSSSATTPTRAHLAVLHEGIRLFPRRPVLLLRTAELHLRHGYRDEVAPLVEIGLRVTEDEALRAQFDRLQRQLAEK